MSQGWIRNAHKILVGKFEGRDLSIDEKIMLKFNFRGRRHEDVGWIHLAEDSGQKGVKGCMVIDPQDP
jgi:hypothetical protein